MWSTIEGCSGQHPLLKSLGEFCPEHGGLWSYKCKACWDHYRTLHPKEMAEIDAKVAQRQRLERSSDETLGTY